MYDVVFDAVSTYEKLDNCLKGVNFKEGHLCFVESESRYYVYHNDKWISSVSKEDTMQPEAGLYSFLQEHTRLPNE